MQRIVTNIILDAVFVAGLDWGVAGAAWATVIGQILSTIFGGYLLFNKKTLVSVQPKIFRLNRTLYPKIISCGFAFWVAQMAMGFISLVYTIINILPPFFGQMAIALTGGKSAQLVERIPFLQNIHPIQRT